MTRSLRHGSVIIILKNTIFFWTCQVFFDKILVVFGRESSFIRQRKEYKMRYVLGLDLGPASVGWAAIKLDERGEYRGFADLKDGDSLFPAIGVRIFPFGVENYGQGKKRETSKNKKRRESRSRRRMLRRRRARRRRLLALLQAKDMVPSEPEKIRKLLTDECVDKKERSFYSYKLRTKGLREKLSLQEFSRILLHLAKRRGFQSNRKVPQDKDDAGKVLAGIKRFEREVSGKTPGQVWHDRLAGNPSRPIRNRKGRNDLIDEKGKAFENYHWVAKRDQYRDELWRLWRTQREFYQEVLTEEFGQEVSKILFDQLPFELSRRKKKKVIGTCSLIKGKLRCPLSDRMAQEFRLLQKVNDLRVTRKSREVDWRDKREDLIRTLSINKELPFKKVRKILRVEETDRINFEYEANDKLIGNEIDSQLKKIFEDSWDKLEDGQKKSVWQKILGFLNNETEAATAQQVADEIKAEFGLTVSDATVIEKIDLPKGYIAYSKEALEKLLPLMREGKDLYTAIQGAGFKQKRRALEKLLIPDKANGFDTTNPVVRTVMFEVRKVVNSLIRELGKPAKIIVEFARELKADKERRAEIIKGQGANKTERENAEKKIRKYRELSENAEVSSEDVKKYLLCKEQRFHSAYSGKPISMEQLLSPDTEIDHILPRSVIADNSMNNLVVCFRWENQDKGQRTPIDWLGGDEDRWTQCLGAIDHWNPKRKKRGRENEPQQGEGEQDETTKPNKDKWERFFVRTDEIDENYIERKLLSDTSYIARWVREYLKQLYTPESAERSVKTTKGIVTWGLRNWWKVNRILGSADDKKNRADLRHHAIDAAVVAVTDSRMIIRVTKCVRQAGPTRRTGSVNVDPPWDGFDIVLKAVVDSLNVSHRPQGKVQGALHKETHYGKEEQGQCAGKYITRLPLHKLKEDAVERICDKGVKKIVKKRLEDCGGDIKKAFSQPIPFINRKGEVVYHDGQEDRPVLIKGVRVWKESATMIPVRPNVWVEPGDNHHVEIFRHKSNGKAELVCKVWSVFDVAQRIKNKQPIVLRKHPDLEFADAEFVMSLCKGDSLMLKNKNGDEVIARIEGISGKPNHPRKIDIDLCEIHVGDTTKLGQEERDKLRRQLRISSFWDFAKRNVRKISIDTLGRVRWAEKKYWGHD